VLTLASAGRIELEIKRSRFVAHAARVDSMADTLAFFESVADPEATHNCWAWKLDHQYRFNDDGEPASTAGRPILAAIEGKGLDHAMVVVTRYYGGTKLGVGGLVRAYSGSAARSIDEAQIVEIQATVECLIEAGFSSTGSIHSAIQAVGATRLSEDFSDQGVLIQVELPEISFDSLVRTVRDMSRGKARVRKSAGKSLPPATPRSRRP
jgi:uncharacterized YigZ family protein